MNNVASELTDAVETGVDLVSSLPAPVQTGFIKAMGRLVGGALATPAAWLRGPAQAIEDKTDARSIVTRRIAEAAAERAAADPEIIERAMQSLVREEFRKQTNKEQIISSAAEALTAADSSDATPTVDAEVDDDWMNVFVRYAEDASSARMQNLWGRVLAGEIRKPGAYSLSTIRFLSELDTETAKTFENVAPLVTGTFIFFDSANDNAVFNDALSLESAGLVTVSAGMLTQEAILNDDGLYHFIGKHLGLQIEGVPSTKFNIPVIILTRLGNEVMSLLPHYDETNQLRRVAKSLEAKTGIEKMTICELIYTDGVPSKAKPLDVIWQRPPEVR